MGNYHTAELSREKTFTNLAVLEPPVKIFSMKFGRAVPTYDTFSIPQKFSL